MNLSIFNKKYKQNKDNTLNKLFQEKFKGIFHESVVAIYIFDKDKNFIDSNEAGLELLGYSRKELLSMSIPQVDADTEVVKPTHKHLLSGGRIVNFEHKLKRKDGKTITVLNNSRSLKDDNENIIGLLSTINNITERVEAENELKKHKDHLDVLVKERTVELEKALIKVKQLQGLLPICSSCKKIRDDNNNWEQIEQYITDRSDAEFTHSLCPECAHNLYPEINNK